ncbi:hypothetical protein Acsp04_66030 [Actinomadura sp. NBRC 104425]|uniref:toprim domain-containing protein n=1 Tax=Actinomadura sp. NBRC 104425 TaxID=3032204 RepID=UPI0024A3DF3F|nr:toprim domain-containing protein [Actinomadura sp. NBRC 104425]GLZ16368.1 hypothetical protein Acsp04_66030 [Actinomadura sp. NBRC 104425]
MTAPSSGEAEQSVRRLEEQQRQVEVLRTVADQVVADIHQGRLSWADWLQQASRHGRYGFTNSLLIPAQRRTATDVRSYDAWQKQGRQVQRGETGIRIISRRGKPASVFDIEQTAGAALDEPPRLTAAEGLERLCLLAAKLGLYVDRGQRWPYLDRLERRVALAAELDDVAAATELAHQLAHVLSTRDALHSTGNGRTDCYGARRVRADSVAFLVLAELGLPVDRLSFPPPAQWAGTDHRANPTAAVRAMGETVLRTASGLRHRLRSIASPLVTRQVETPPLRTARPKATKPETGRRDELLAVLADAHTFYTELITSGWGADYLAARGFDADVQKRWGVGHAPRGPRALVEHLRRLGHADEQIMDAGLARPGKDGDLVDLFRDRVLLPFRDEDGSVVGFIGRRRDGARGPKYLNSPDTPLFHKKAILYGLHESRDHLARGGRPLIVEGPLDAIAVNSTMPQTYAAVAPCGTAITPDHLDALARYADLNTTGLVLALDGDDAGRAAALRAWQTLRVLTGPIDAALLPQGRDPADLLTSGSRAHLEQALGSLIPLADLLVDEKIKRHGGTLEFVEQRLAAARAAAGLISQLPPDQIARQVARVASRTQVEAAEITAAVAAAISPEPASDICPARWKHPAMSAAGRRPSPPRRSRAK